MHIVIFLSNTNDARRAF